MSVNPEPTLREQIVQVELEAIHWLASGRGLPMVRTSMSKAITMIDAHNAAKRSQELSEWKAGQAVEVQK